MRIALQGQAMRSIGELRVRGYALIVTFTAAPLMSAYFVPVFRWSECFRSGSPEAVDRYPEWRSAPSQTGLESDGAMISVDDSE